MEFRTCSWAANAEKKYPLILRNSMKARRRPRLCKLSQLGYYDSRHFFKRLSLENTLSGCGEKSYETAHYNQLLPVKMVYSLHPVELQLGTF